MASKMKVSIRNTFIAGIIALMPVAVTYYFILLFVKFFDNMVRPLLDPLVGFHIPGLGLVVSLILIYFLGLLVTHFIGKRALNLFEKWLSYIPVARTIYQTTKQVLNALTLTKSGFEKVVFVEYPRRSCWTLAFVTGKSQNAAGLTFVHLFLPTTPNPTSGWVLFVPEQDVIPAEMTIEQGLKAIISGGAVTPEVIHIANDSAK